jgi:hypothetical protein
VTTFVQQIDAQGPAVMSRITTQFADIACTPENAKLLVDSLHGGTSVTLNASGKTATFTPSSKPLGYGEAYIALALAAEALRNAGVTGCATPEQWQAVLLGGPLAATGTATSSTTRIASGSASSRFPGILALRSQGQGWGQIAQSANIQLGQVMSNAHSSLNISSSTDTTLSPTGRSSSDFNSSRSTTSPSTSSTRDDSATKPGGKDKDADKDKSSTGKDKDTDRSSLNDNPATSSRQPASSSSSPTSSPATPPPNR